MNLDFQIARRRMVSDQLELRGIYDQRLLAAMKKIPREEFVSGALRDQAYADHPLNIGDGQTISQPYIVAQMTQALELGGDERVLEIGTGCGYQTAVLLELAREVYSIERLPRFSHRARKTLYKLGYDLFHLRVGDGTLGWPEAAPFDAIIATAGSSSLPQPLVDQMADGGRLVCPVGTVDEQDLLLCRRFGKRVESRTLGKCRFVKLVGRHGWNELQE